MANDKTKIATRTARCLCGAVSFSVDLPVGEDGSIEVGACHCGMCRRWGGGPNLSVHPAADPELPTDAPIGFYRGSDWGERGFCRKCGANLIWRLQSGGMAAVPAGLFDDQSGFGLGLEIYVDQRPDYYAFAGERKEMTEAEVVAMFAGGGQTDET